ncbi:PREDICTED: 28S ribosomal protein S18b, mitochondrial [Dipodomys ordii]|uniref:28S ribosomal protein S18b, mitochondrial n=1 Tax=Dipodomys ordii TaxID=10020 RepID=A0A1S3GCY7_DIPOR|nr:PREDICTED: 28S ribosomal protein S18b, mitochondrial [Dipodomys ordii]
MAASVLNTLWGRFPRLLRFQSAYGVQVPFQTLCTKASTEKDSLPSLPISPYENEPWKYLESKEYENRYGSHPVWADYRRNHKGGVPPQWTRKTCIRKNKVAGNPCPICRDHKLHIDFRVPHMFLYSGLLRYHIPQVEPRDLDFSTSHGAVSATPPAPTLVSGEPWYPWYSWKQPPERELSRLRRLYQGNLKEESGPPPESMPELPLKPQAEASKEDPQNAP